MLTDKTMEKLAAACGWEFYEVFHLHGGDYGPCWLGDGVIRAVRLEDNKNTLTDAGCWQASGLLDMDVVKTGSGTWDAVCWQSKEGPAAGSAVHPDRATALMLAIQEVYS